MVNKKSLLFCKNARNYPSNTTGEPSPRPLLLGQYDDEWVYDEYDESVKGGKSFLPNYFHVYSYDEHART